MLLTVLVGTLVLVLIHLFAGRLRFLDVVPRSRWLSFGSGISVAYVFLRLLPELGEAQGSWREHFGGAMVHAENQVYILAALGLAVFYGLERLAEQSREKEREGGREDSTSRGVFWLHIVFFSVYNALIGYVLAEESEGLVHYALFLLAMALHFLVNDYGLRLHHKEAYHRTGRWVLSAAVVVGGVAGTRVEIPEAYLFVPLGFLAGAIILNVLKEELPDERKSRFGSFAIGMGAYGALLIAV
jgi:hypothetical protein